MIQTNMEYWLCNTNNISGFFSFFGAVIGYYGLKYTNKEYIKTVGVSLILTYHSIVQYD